MAVFTLLKLNIITLLYNKFIFLFIPYIMEESNSKYYKQNINVVNATNVQKVKYKYEFKFKNFLRAMFYSVIILGNLFNVYGIILAFVRSIA